MMDNKTEARKNLNSIQTRSFLSGRNSSIADLSDFESLRLDPGESCRALLANFAYCWSVAEASGLLAMAEIAEIGIVEMSVRLGYALGDVRKSPQSAFIVVNSNCTSKVRTKSVVLR
jgi:hypothetical protein